jgi:hypothetical protein
VKFPKKERLWDDCEHGKMDQMQWKTVVGAEFCDHSDLWKEVPKVLIPLGLANATDYKVH